jgi:hypothetical protein
MAYIGGFGRLLINLVLLCPTLSPEFAVLEDEHVNFGTLFFDGWPEEASAVDVCRFHWEYCWKVLCTNSLLYLWFLYQFLIVLFWLISFHGIGQATDDAAPAGTEEEKRDLTGICWCTQQQIHPSS